MTKKVGRIRDVAKETGLSIATISRVMNGAKNVTPETRKRVLEASRKLDYLPNPAARALSTAKSKTIAAIIPTIEHSVFAKFIAAIEQTLSSQGYSLVLAISNSDPEIELSAAKKLLGMGAEAFILCGADHSAELFDLFDRRGVPYVFSSIWDPDSAVSTFGYDNRALARDAVQYLVAKGHNDIAVIHGPLNDSDRARARWRGAHDAKTADLTLDFFETALAVTGGKSGIAQVLDQPKDYTAVLCFSDVLALGVYFGMTEAGLTVPDDISVMGFDNLDWSSSVVPALTTINLPARTMGADIARQLMAHLDQGVALHPQKLEGVIVERASVADLTL